METILELAKKLEFSTESDYFNYILDTKLNGNNKQFIELVQEVRKNGFINDLINHIEELGYNDIINQIARI